MIELVQQILTTALFDGAEQPFVVMPDGAIDPPDSLLPDNCRLELPTTSATTYLASLWNLLETHRPACLLLIPPLTPAEELPLPPKFQAKSKKAWPPCKPCWGPRNS